MILEYSIVRIYQAEINFNDKNYMLLFFDLIRNRLYFNLVRFRENTNDFCTLVSAPKYRKTKDRSPIEPEPTKDIKKVHASIPKNTALISIQKRFPKYFFLNL